MKQPMPESGRTRSRLLSGAARANLILLTSLVFALVIPTLVRGGLRDQIGISVVIEDRVMVRTHPLMSVDAFIDAFEMDYPGVTLETLDTLAGVDTYLLNIDLPEGMEYVSLEDNLSEDYSEFLEWGEFLYKSAAPEGHTGSLFVDGIDEDWFHNQYAVDTLNLEAANFISTGYGSVVALLDTGVDHTHPFLTGHVLGDSLNLVDATNVTLDIGDGVDTDGDGQVDEMVGHGTFVAGLIVLAAPDVRILPIRILNGDGEGHAWNVAKAIYFAVGREADVINMSLGSTYDSGAVRDAIDFARQRGVFTVSAAGNLNRNTPEEYPAMLPIGFGVAATNSENVKAEFSNYDVDLAISAPGASELIDGNPMTPDLERSIVSTVPGGGYAVWSGTSMSGAWVSAAAAMIRAQNPEWIGNGQAYESIKATLQGSAADISALNPVFSDRIGAGLLDIYAALESGPAVGDINNDGAVDVDDLILVILAWGNCPPWPESCPEDVAGESDAVDIDDLIAVILDWGEA